MCPPDQFATFAVDELITIAACNSQYRLAEEEIARPNSAERRLERSGRLADRLATLENPAAAPASANGPAPLRPRFKEMADPESFMLHREVRKKKT